MRRSNLNASKDKLSHDIRSLLQKQEKILLKIKKEDAHLLDIDAERIFLRECNNHLRIELSDLNSLVRGLMHPGIHF